MFICVTYPFQRSERIIFKTGYGYNHSDTTFNFSASASGGTGTYYYQWYVGTANPPVAVTYKLVDIPTFMFVSVTFKLATRLFVT